MNYHAADGGAFVTPPLPVYASAAQLVQAHPRASVWVLSAFLATPRFASFAFGGLSNWRSILDMLELKVQLPLLPIVDARAPASTDVLLAAGMQAVCSSEPVFAREDGMFTMRSEANIPRSELSKPDDHDDDYYLYDDDDDGDTDDTSALNTKLQQQQRRTAGSSGASSTPEGGWLAALLARLLPQELHQLHQLLASHLSRPLLGSTPARSVPFPFPMANCTVWNSRGHRVASFRVSLEERLLQPRRAAPTWRSRAEGLKGWLLDWMEWFMWPRWRLLRLLPLVWPDMRWVAASAAVAGESS